MSEPIVSIDAVKRNARAAAEQGMSLTACPYPIGSDAERLWKVEHTARELCLSGVVVTVGEYE